MELQYEQQHDSSSPRLRPPYLLFFGDAVGARESVVGQLLAEWRPEVCIGQLRHANCRVDVGLPDLDVRQARRAGAQSLLIAVRPQDRRLRQVWESTLHHALESRLDLVSPLTESLDTLPRLANAAYRNGRRLVDLRRLRPGTSPARGQRRSGRRLLTVGEDAMACSWTALALHRSLRQAGVAATFRGTGPAGVLISGAGCVLEGMPADGLSGAAEALCPANETEHWDVVQGQGSLDDPTRAPLTVALLHGVQPDALVLCLARLPEGPGAWRQLLGSLRRRIRRHEETARLTCPGSRCVALSVDTRAVDDVLCGERLAELERASGLAAVDPRRDGAERILQALNREFGLTAAA